MIYSYEEIFEDIPGDPDNCLMRIPEEILEKMKLTEGSVVDVEVINGSIIISKV